MTYREKEIPCFGCEKRQFGCHSKCSEYAAYSKKNKERSEEVIKKKEISVALIENTRKQAKRSGKYLRNVYY